MGIGIAALFLLLMLSCTPIVLELAASLIVMTVLLAVLSGVIGTIGIISRSLGR